MKNENADKTAEIPQKKAIGRPFEKGNKANPNGRPKGAVNEVTKFKEAIARFEKENKTGIYDLILKKALTNPKILATVFKALIPQQTESNLSIKYENPYSNLSDQELIDKANAIINGNKPPGTRRDISRA